MKKFCFLLVLLSAVWTAHGQYLENFTGQDGKGLVDAGCTGASYTTCTPLANLTGVTWTISGDFSGFDPGSPDDFGVVSERFQASDNDNETCWISPTLNIASAGAVSISINAGSSNDLEPEDYIKAEYSLNGGAFVQFGIQQGTFTTTTFSVSGLTGNTLAIRVCIDDNGGSEIIWFDNVSVPQSGVFINCAQPNVTAVVTDVVCTPNSGAIDLTVSGGSPPYTYAWTGGATSQDRTGLAPGTYSVTVTDNANCPIVKSYTVNNSPIVQNAATYPAYCDEANGSINLNVSGGIPPYTYAWTGGATTQDLMGVSAGNYTVTITDNINCTSVQTYTVGSQSLSPGPYLETFSTPNKGYLTNLQDDLFGVNWTLSPWTQGMPGRDAADYFQTTADGRLEAVDVDFEVCWSSPMINIAGAGSVQFSVDLTWQTLEAQDYIAVQYSVDGAPYLEIANIAGNGSHTVQYTGGINTNSGTASISGLTGSTLQIRICFLAESNTDIITIDNVSIPQTVSLCFGPPNDLCSAAADLNCGSTLTGTIDGASATGAPSGCSGGGTPQAGVWYKFTGNGQVATVSTAGSTFDTQLNVYTGTCGSLTCVDGDDNSGPANTSQVTFCTTNGTVYYIYVDGTTAAPTGDISISLSCAPSTSPTIACPSNQTGVVGALCEYTMADFRSLATVVDDCPGYTIVQVPSVGASLSGAGPRNVSLTVTDASGNTDDCNFTLTLLDQTAPNVSCPPGSSFSDAVVDADCENPLADYATQFINNGWVTDNCDSNPTVSQSPAPGTITGTGNVIVTITATDASNNSNTNCSFSIKVVDKTPPTASNPELLTFSCESEVPAPDPDVVTDESDNCGNVTVTFLNDTDNGGIGSAGDPLIITRTYQLEDLAGNTSTVTQTINVSESEAPEITCPDNISVNTDPDQCSAVVTFEATATDNCESAPTIGYSQDPNTAFSTGVTNVTATADDGNGNTANCSFNVTVTDNQAPDAVCQNITAQLNAAGNVSVTAGQVNNGTSDNCGISSLSLSPVVFNCASVGANTVTLTVTDVNANSSTCTATVTVEDGVSPSAVCRNITVQLDANGNGSTSAQAIDNGSSDACGIASLNLNKTSFGCADTGSNTVTLTATDVNGNSSTCTASVTVEDNAPATAVCKTFTLNLTSDGITTLDPLDVSDGSFTACGDFSLSVSPSGFDCNDIGSNTVTLTATDLSNGNSSPCTTTVTVADPNHFCCAPPDAVCQNITVQLNTAGSASITAASVDNSSTFECGLLSMILDITDFDCSDVGPNTVTLTVTDVNNDADQCTATVTVEDNVAPTALCRNVTVQLDATGDGSTTAAAVDNGSSDACGIQSAVLSLQSFGCADVGANTVTLTVTDVNDNASTCSATVTVEDNQAPTALCNNITVLLDGDGQGEITAVEVDNGSSDACGILSLDLNQSKFNCEHVGTVGVTLTVTDQNNNENTCSATVTVEDPVAPAALCRNVTVQLDADGNGATSAEAVDNGSNDACGIQSAVLSRQSFSCVDVGANTVTLTVTDVNDNTSTCTATVTVADNIAPVALCQNVTVQLDENGTGSTTAAAVDNGSSDACGIQSAVLSRQSFSCADVGGNTVTLTVKDVNDNTSTCTATVTVEDHIDPVIACTNRTVTFNGEADIELDPNDLATASDNCGVESLVPGIPAIDCQDLGEVIPVIVTASDASGNSASCTANITVTGLPCGWMQMPDGIGCTNGNEADYDVATGTFTLSATGCYTPSATADESGFIKYLLCGDGSITAHIAGLTLPGFAGIVMRETDDPGSKKVAMVYQGANALQRFARYTTNGASFPSYIPTAGSRWLRIVRTGNTFRGYHSVNGTYWIYAFAVTVPMNSCIQVGLIASGTNPNSAVTATFDHVVIDPPYGNNPVRPIAIEPSFEEAAEPGLALWPNPATGKAYLLMNGGWGQAVEVKIMDGLGRIIQVQQTDPTQDRIMALDMSNQLPGVYFIRVQNQEGRTEILRLAVSRP